MNAREEAKQRNKRARQMAAERPVGVAAAIRRNIDALIDPLPADALKPIKAGGRLEAPGGGLQLAPARILSLIARLPPRMVQLKNEAATLTWSLNADDADEMVALAGQIAVNADGLALLTLAVERYLPEPLERRHMLAATERKRHKDALILTRQHGVLNHVSLTAFEVDGEPLATATPAGDAQKRWRLAQPEQGSLYPGPRTIAGKAVGGALVETVADLNLAGDERNPIRADLLKIGNLAYALTGPAVIPAADGARIIAAGAKLTAQHAVRFENAVRVLRWLEVRLPGYPLPFNLADAEFGGGVARVGPPRWICDPDAPTVYRLTGSLFRKASWSGALERTVAGIEGVLSYGPAAGKGRDGRIPDYLRPVHSGGPGPEVFIPWWQVLRLSSEPVGPDADPKSAAGRRYRRRVVALVDAGYLVGPKGQPAPAGDTIEVVRIVRGARARPAGLVVRATARYCAAVRDQVKTRIPASRLIESPK